jgi:hypothetical protein
MKTQVFKNGEFTTASNLMLVAATIVFGGILLFNTGNSPVFLGNNLLETQVKPQKELFTKIQPATEPVENVLQSTKNEKGTNISLETIQEYLVPAQEENLTVSAASSIVFPEVKTEIYSAENNNVNSDNFLANLKHQANEKTREAVELYAMVKKVREFLTIETEKPLCLENWMLNRKCWCSEPEEKLAFSEGN